MKLPWPAQFADGDLQPWLENFEAICSCNGVNGSMHRLTALSKLLMGRAKAAFELIRKEYSEGKYSEIRGHLLNEFSKEQDRHRAMDRFYNAVFDSSQDPMVHYQYLSRQLAIGLPDADERSRMQLLRDRFLQSLPEDIREKVSVAVACGLENMDKIVAVVQRMQASVKVNRIEAETKEDKVAELIAEVGRLKLQVEQQQMARKKTDAIGHRTKDRSVLPVEVSVISLDFVQIIVTLIVFLCQSWKVEEYLRLT